MSRRRKTNYPGSKSFGSELAKEGTITQKKESISTNNLLSTQKQVCETKAIISDVFDRLERIKRENEEAKQDWGTVEQNAYERLLEGSIVFSNETWKEPCRGARLAPSYKWKRYIRNVSGKEFLDWLSDLEQEQDV